MRAKEFLTELGSAPLPYTSQRSLSTMKFRNPELDLNVYFFFYGPRLDIEFSVGGMRSMTGGGNAIQILSTVKNILQKELPSNLRGITRIEFFAEKDEPSRIKLYDRAVPILANILGPNWGFSNSDENEDDYDDEIKTYRWEKKS